MVVLTVAVFDIDVGAVSETAATIVIVAECPGPGEGARSGTEQVTVVVPEHTTPAEPLADTYVVSAGSVSETLTPLAVLPVEVVAKFVTVML